MKKVLSVNLERKITTNAWIIKIRWIYIAGIFLISLLTKLMGHDQLELSLVSILSLFTAFAIVNLALYFAQKMMENNFSIVLLSLISYAQIIIELIFFTIMIHFFGGIESISTAYFFLPVVSASLIFGAAGSVITAIVASILINTLMIESYVGMMGHTASSTNLMDIEFHREHITAIKTITSSIFYIIVGLFSGYSADMLFKREKSIEEKVLQLDEQTQKMAEEKNKTLAIITNFIDPIIVLDKFYKISMINPAANRVFGLTAADLGKQVSSDKKFSIANFKPIIKKDYVIKQIDKPIKEQAFVSEEIIIKEKNQEVIYRVMTAEILSVDNKSLGLMKIFYDTTREKMIDRMKSEFISVAAHQLRTPLSTVKWVINIILESGASRLNLKQREMLNKGYLSNERMIKLVDNLLNISRIEEGKFGFDFKKVDFKEVLEEALANVEKQTAKNHPQIVIKKPENLPMINLDKERMTMVMQNLMANAIKYSPANKKIEVDIKADKKNLVVKITDQGAGIPLKDQPKIFLKFFRASNALKMKTEGNGLGLFIVKNIIEKHNGQIKLISEEGKGTEVVFSIPLNQPAG